MPMQTFDVVVLGTGVAGLVAAVASHDRGATVGLFEKGDLVGGTTAMSGGVAWLPNNRIGRAAGFEDSRAQSLAYLRSLSNGMAIDAMLEAFVDGTPEMIDWLESSTPVRFQFCKIPDYHPERPGGLPGGGRSVEAAPFSLLELGPWADRITTGQYSELANGDVHIATVESPRAGGSGVIADDELQFRRKTRTNTKGRALVGALLKACLDRGIAPVTEARARELLIESGRVVGVRIEKDGQMHHVVARRGVVIATGGFEWDAELRRAFLRGPIEYPTSAPTNAGDGLKLAMRVGAMLGSMREAWWMPVIKIPGELQYGQQKVVMILRERSLPGCIMVNRRGRRFCNEATNYNSLGAAFHHFDPVMFDYANIPCWLVFDRTYVDKYGFWKIPPAGEMPDWVARADTPAALARSLGIDADNLVEALKQWNRNVAIGRDPDYGRGDSAYDGWNGDATLYPHRDSTLGPIEEPPFYAVELHASTLGTKGGPQTDRRGAVLNVDGQTIPGLYAAGNAMSAPTGTVYAGAGGTIGPALVFGYLAGRAAAEAAGSEAASAIDWSDLFDRLNLQRSALRKPCVE
jgi:succinate dehydrogenase/fumarate reductase flavoprotein subunit